jgi:hypothetical protein
VTLYRAFDALSSYFLCSNDSNGVCVARKLVRALEMSGNWVRENGVWLRRLLGAVGFDGREMKAGALKTAGCGNRSVCGVEQTRQIRCC